MSDRKFLAVVGLAFGFATFLAVGMASFIVIAEVQSRYAPTVVALEAHTGYAQVDSPFLTR